MKDEHIPAHEITHLRHMINVLLTLEKHGGNSKNKLRIKSGIYGGIWQYIIDRLVELELVNIKEIGKSRTTHWITINNKGRETLNKWRKFDQFFFNEQKNI